MVLTFTEKYTQDIDRIKAYAEHGAKYVEVYVNTESKTLPCRSCTEQSGIIYTVEEALKSMPIPLKGCTNEYGCRCLYLPVIEE